MRTLKLFAVAVAIMISGNIFAETKPIPGKKSFSYEIAKFFDNGKFIIDEDHRGKVYFSLNEERKITVHYVSFKDREVKEYIAESLQDKKLRDVQWEVGKVYSLPLLMRK